MTGTVDVSDACYTHGTFFVVPMNTEFTSNDGNRGVVSVDADGYKPLKDKGLMDQRVYVQMVAADNDITDTEGWSGEAGLRTIKVTGTDPKPQLMLGENDIEAIVAAGITDGTYCDLTIAKLG